MCVALHVAARAMSAQYRPLLEDLGVTYPQYLVLLALWDEKRCSVSRLGQRLSLDSGTLSPLLKRLESAGLITRKRNSHDERSVIIGLTGAGRGLRAGAGRIDTALCAALDMTAVDQANLVDRLHALNDRLNQAESTSTGQHQNPGTDRPASLTCAVKPL
jgi:DNA-binding MarR family transcriptional regulator